MKQNKLKIYFIIAGGIIFFSYIGCIQPIMDSLIYKVCCGLLNTLPVFMFYKIMKSYIGLWDTLNKVKKISLVSLGFIMVVMPIFFAVEFLLNTMSAIVSSSTGSIVLLVFPIIPIFILFLASIPYIILNWNSSDPS